MQATASALQSRQAFSAASFGPQPPRRRRRCVAAHASAVHVHWLNEIAQVNGRPAVEPLLRVLEAQGQSVVAPSERSGLHPLLMPLAGSSSSGSSEPEHVTCLLRWGSEGHSVLQLPVVRMARGGTSMTLLARSIDEYLQRALAEEDSRSGPGGPVAEAAGSEGAALYEPGSVESSGLPSLNAYLTRKVGLFPDVAEALALAHLEKGDTMSALITGEWYMRNSHFPGWGRPYEFNCDLMQRVGRNEERRDVARLALRLPWVTFTGGYQHMRDAAGLSGGTADVRQALADQDEMSNMPSGLRTAVRTEQQQFLDDALWLLNSAAAGETRWDDIREGVAALYNAGGLSDVAGFIMHA